MMGAETTYYVKVPVVTYEWKEVSAVTKDEALKQIPHGVDVKDVYAFERDVMFKDGDW